MNERRIRLVLEYDGTGYAGWQRQNNGVSIQQRLEEELHSVTGEWVRVTGSGRTDSGVHALAQVAHFDTHSRIPADKFTFALNAGLPRDIRIKQSDEVSGGFHARFSAKRKWYRYTVEQSAHESAFYYRTRLHIHRPLNVEHLNEAARLFCGEHDFSAFRSAGVEIASCVRMIYRSEWTRQEQLFYYDVEGSGFLYHMVRILVGSLLEVEKGKRTLAQLKQALCDGAPPAGPTAPARGLCLQSVFYEES